MKSLELAQDLEEVLAGRLSIDVVLDERDYWPELDTCYHGQSTSGSTKTIEAGTPGTKRCKSMKCGISSLS
jgi:hypothetical protein